MFHKSLSEMKFYSFVEFHEMNFSLHGSPFSLVSFSNGEHWQSESWVACNTFCKVIHNSCPESSFVFVLHRQHHDTVWPNMVSQKLIEMEENTVGKPPSHHFRQAEHETNRKWTENVWQSNRLGNEKITSKWKWLKVKIISHPFLVKSCHSPSQGLQSLLVLTDCSTRLTPVHKFFLRQGQDLYTKNYRNKQNMIKICYACCACCAWINWFSMLFKRVRLCTGHTCEAWYHHRM